MPAPPSGGAGGSPCSCGVCANVPLGPRGGVRAGEVVLSGEELTGVQALYDGCSINQVAGAQRAGEVRVQICDFDPVRLHFIHLG